MNMRVPERDERTVVVENAGYRWSYLVLSFGLLLVVAARSFFRRESPWDLLALVVLGGFVNAIYQGTHRVLYRRWVVVSGLTLLIAAALGAGIAWLRR
jgi:hypothetical protein